MSVAMWVPRASGAVRAALFLGAREIRTAMRTPMAFLPGLFFPLLFFFIQVGSLSGFARRYGIPDYKAFQLPVGILFAVSNGGAGLNMVTDIESGFFDKLLLTPVSRLSLLVGAMGADFVRVFFQGLLVSVVAIATGMHFATGLLGALAMVAMASLWGFAFSAIGFAIALKTGNSQATQSIWLILFPFLFMSTSFAPLEALSGWLRTVATYNPMTYLLRGLRAFAMTGWNGHDIGIGLLVVGAVGVVTISMSFAALRGRVR